MPTIPSTRVSTPRAGGAISICKGFNLFAPGTGIDLAFEWNQILLDVEPTVLAWKLRCRSGFGAYAGWCGPSYAADITLQGSSDGQTLTLNASQSEVLAGLEMGIGVRLMLYFDLSQWTVESHWVSDGWNSHLEINSYWASVGRFQIDATIDLIQIIIYALISMGQNPKVAPARFPTGSGLAMIDKNGNDLANNGSAQVEPKFFMIINIFDKFPGAAAVLAWLNKIGGYLYAGPDIVLSAPTTVTITKAATDGVEYAVTTANKVMTGTRSGTSSVGPTTVQLTLQHSSSIGFGLGLGFCLTVLKIFSYSYSTGPLIDLLALMHLTPHFGPFDNTIDDEYGAAAPPAGVAPGSSGCCYEVLLDAPEAAAAV